MCRRRHVMLVLAVSAAARGAEPSAVLTVGPGAEHADIASAVAAAPAGAIVRVGPGTYRGRVTIDRDVTVEGAGWDRTTVIVEQPPFEQLAAARQEFMQASRKVGDERERERLSRAYGEQWTNAAITVAGGASVTVRGLKVTSSPSSLPEAGMSNPQALVAVEPGGTLRLDRCAVVGSPGDGLRVASGGVVDVDGCLVAAAQSVGIAVAPHPHRDAPARVTVRGSDVRNCYHMGISIGRGRDATIGRCRISGSAWHGIRYDDAGPRVTGNHIFGNAHCGIYASGQTAAVVEENLFVGNEIDGMSCWFQNADTVRRNTFAGNAREGLAVLGASAPTVDRNLFV